MINLEKNEAALERTIKLARERNIVIPTLHHMAHPEDIPEKIKDSLKSIGLWDINSLNLFRITWKNEPKEKGGLFGGVNYIVLPEELTGVKAKIVALVGKWFLPAATVGASFGCLVPVL